MHGRHNWIGLSGFEYGFRKKKAKSLHLLDRFARRDLCFSVYCDSPKVAHEDPLASVPNECGEVDKSSFLLAQIKQPVDLDTLRLNCWVGPVLIGRGRMSAVPPYKAFSSPRSCAKLKHKVRVIHHNSWCGARRYNKTAFSGSTPSEMLFYFSWLITNWVLQI